MATNTRNLSKEALVDIVRRIREIMYADGEETEWDSDTTSYIAEVLADWDVADNEED